MRWRAVTTSRAGLEAVGKTVWTVPRLKGLGCEKFPDGSTGPIVRSEAAKSGSRPSRSIARNSVSVELYKVKKLTAWLGWIFSSCVFFLLLDGYPGSAEVHTIRFCDGGLLL